MNQVYYVFLGGGFLVIGIFTFFFSFSGTSIKTPLEKTVASVEQMQSERSAWVTIEKQNDTYAVVIENPKKKNIQSVELTIAYPSQIISVSNLSIPSPAVLELVFPGKAFEIDDTNGLISITAGFAGKAQNIPERFVVATFSAKKEKTETGFFSFPLHREEKTQQIIILENEKMLNIIDTQKLKNFGL